MTGKHEMAGKKSGSNRELLEIDAVSAMCPVTMYGIKVPMAAYAPPALLILEIRAFGLWWPASHARRHAALSGRSGEPDTVLKGPLFLYAT